MSSGALEIDDSPLCTFLRVVATADPFVILISTATRDTTRVSLYTLNLSKFTFPIPGYSTTLPLGFVCFSPIRKKKKKSSESAAADEKE